MTPLSTIATEAELFVNDFITSFSAESDGFSLNETHLVVVRNENEGIIVEPVSHHADVYALIDETVAETPFIVRSSDVLAVITTGWAAPLNADGSMEGIPSEHAERRRVRLMAFIRRSDLTAVSVLRFADTNETVLDEGQATGTLAEALLDLGNAGK